MKELKIHKAGLLGDKEPRSVTIIIDLDLPSGHDVVLGIEDTFDHDARELARALFSSLPQGTLDRLLIQIMKRKVSIYRGLTRS